MIESADFRPMFLCILTLLRKNDGTHCDKTIDLHE